MNSTESNKTILVGLSIVPLLEQALFLGIVAFLAQQWILPPVQHLVGLAYEGEGRPIVVADHTEAAHWFELAAKPRTLTDGYARSQYTLSSMLRQGRGVPADIPRANKLLEAAASQGYAPALNDLGYLYGKGEGVELDLVKARKLYEAAAEGGNAYALCNLANFHLYGTTVPKDEAKAVELMERSFEVDASPCGPLLAKALLEGLTKSRDEKRAYAVLEAATKAGNREAELFALELKAEGTGTPADKPGAVRRLRALNAQALDIRALSLAARLGDSDAQARLGTMLLDRDQFGEAAIEWLGKAADQGNALAMETLATAYEQGKGVAPDPAAASKWYERAAAAGSGDAAVATIKRAARSNDDAQFARALSWLERAAQEGNKAAQLELAVQLKEVDAQRAYAWANLAAAQDHQAATAVRAELEQRLSLEGRLAAQRLSREVIALSKNALQ